MKNKPTAFTDEIETYRDERLTWKDVLGFIVVFGALFFLLFWLAPLLLA